MMKGWRLSLDKNTVYTAIVAKLFLKLCGQRGTAADLQLHVVTLSKALVGRAGKVPHAENFTPGYFAAEAGDDRLNIINDFLRVVFRITKVKDKRDVIGFGFGCAHTRMRCVDL